MPAAQATDPGAKATGPTKLKADAAPREACRFGAAGFDFAEAGAAAADSHPVRMLARTREPVRHWWWYGGTVYHELDGVAMHKGRIVLDYEHGEEIGWLEADTTDGEGLWLAGEITPCGEAGDPAPRVIARGKRGVPYEASIYFDGPMVVEYVDAGADAEVNGETVEGPCTIVRECRLRAVAVCAHGRDGDTVTEFAEQAADAPRVPLTVKAQAAGEPPENTPGGADAAAMSKPTPGAGEAPPADATTQSAPPADTTTTPDADADSPKGAAEQTAGDAPATDPPADDAPADGRSAFRAELKRFTDAFGAERGAKYFGEDLTFEAALERDHERLSESLAKAHQRLSGLDAAENEGLGESEQGKHTPGGSDKPKGFASRIQVR